MSNPYERFTQKLTNIEVIEAFLRDLEAEGYQVLTPARDYIRPTSDRLYNRILEHYGIDPKILDIEIEERVREQERKQRQREIAARSRAKKEREKPTRPTVVAQ